MFSRLVTLEYQNLLDVQICEAEPSVDHHVEGTWNSQNPQHLPLSSITIYLQAWGRQMAPSRASSNTAHVLMLQQYTVTVYSTYVHPLAVHLGTCNSYTIVNKVKANFMANSKVLPTSYSGQPHLVHSVSSLFQCKSQLTGLSLCSQNVQKSTSQSFFHYTTEIVTGYNVVHYAKAIYFICLKECPYKTS